MCAPPVLEPAALAGLAGLAVLAPNDPRGPENETAMRLARNGHIAAGRPARLACLH